MNSSISPLTFVQQPNAKPAAVGNSNDNHDGAAMHDGETFQSVMSKSDNPDSRTRTNDKQTDQTTLASDKQAKDDRSERAENEPTEVPFPDHEAGSEVKSDDTLLKPSPDLSATEFSENSTSDVELSDETAESREADVTDTADIALPREGIKMSAISRLESGHSDPFSDRGEGVRSQIRSSAPPRTGATVEAALPPIDQADEIAGKGRVTAALTTEVMVQKTTPDQFVETSRQTVNAAGGSHAGGSAGNLAALATASGQTAKTTDDSVRSIKNRDATLTPQVLSAPDVRTSITSQKPAISSASVQAVAMRNAAIQPDKPKEIGSIRWVSEASFSADVAATEMPATSRLQQSVLLQQPDLPRHVAIQLAQAIRQGGLERPMELVLNPAELGRVRIAMHAGDGAMTVHVFADRPETLDLMRRHIDQLAQEFHEIGYGSAEFAFGHNAPEEEGLSDDSSSNDNHATAAGMENPNVDHAPGAQVLLSIHSDRVDIRL